MSDQITMPAYSPDIHPVFLGNGFIEDSYLSHLVSSVMQNEDANPTPMGGLSGRTVSTETSCLLYHIIDLINLAIKKVWHMLCMSWSSDYQSRFTRAVEQITLADRQAAEALRSQEEREAEEALRLQEEQERNEAAKNEALMDIQQLKADKILAKKSLQECEARLFRENMALNGYVQAAKDVQSATSKHFGKKIQSLFQPGRTKMLETAQRTLEQRRLNFQGVFGPISIEEARAARDELVQIKTVILESIEEIKHKRNEKKALLALLCGEGPVDGVQLLAEVHERPLKESEQERFFKEIAEKIHLEVAEIWKMPFAKFDSQQIVSWSYGPESKTYTLHLRDPVQMWVPALDDAGMEETEGGSVLLFGHNSSKIIRVILDSDTKTMKFLEGFEIYFYRNLFFSHRHRCPVVSLQYLQDVQLTRMSIQMCGTHSRDKSLKNFELNWQEQGMIVENFEQCLTEKLGSR